MKNLYSRSPSAETRIAVKRMRRPQTMAGEEGSGERHWPALTWKAEA